MNLVITRIRNDERGFWGGYKGSQFELRYRLELSDEEAVIVREYKLDSYQVRLVPLSAVDTSGHTIGSLLQGMVVTLPDPLLITYFAYYLKQACDAVQLVLDMYRLQSDDEVIAYPRHQAQES